MRSRVIKTGLLCALVAAGACSSETKGPGLSPTAAKAAGGKVCTMQAGGKDVLRVTTPSDAVCTPYDGTLHLESGQRHKAYVWLVPGAASVDEGVTRVAAVIAPEFKGFKATETTASAVAGSPAKRLMGTGVEADDDDPGRADVVVFKAGSRVFVACTHGESMSPKAEEFMMAVVGTATAP